MRSDGSGAMHVAIWVSHAFPPVGVAGGVCGGLVELPALRLAVEPEPHAAVDGEQADRLFVAVLGAIRSGQRSPGT